MKKTFSAVTINNISGGAVVDHFEEGLKQILKNIADANTDPEKIRSLTLKIDFYPKKDRSGAETKVSSSLKTVPVNPAMDDVFFAFNGDEVTAFYTDPQQPELPEVPKNSRPLETAAGGSK